MPRHGFHEEISRDHEVKLGSNRSFGLVFCAAFTLIALLPLISGHPVRWWSLVVAAVFLLVALAAPAVLAPLNRLWAKVGLLLSKIVNPVIMALLFFVVITPIGLIMRALGKDPLRLKTTGETSYWIVRTPPGPKPETMKDQF